MRKLNFFFVVGVGGVGMSSLAHLMNDIGYNVSGSDICENFWTKGLEKRNMKVDVFSM